jgi:hypothetical protein
MSKNHVKLRGDTANEGEGDYYYETEDDLVVRQFCVINNRILWADRNSSADAEYDFTDQPQFDEAEIPEYMGLRRIASTEFEFLWKKGKDACH